MKQFKKVLFLLGAILLLSACGGKQEAAQTPSVEDFSAASPSAATVQPELSAAPDPREEPSASTDLQAGMTADLDLTQLSSTVVYAEVYNMLVTPENYTDKVVRMTGEYQEYVDEYTGELYHSCVIYDALACCQQGVEFVLADGDYLIEGTAITVVGRYETYTTPYYDYFHLVDAVREK